MWNEEQFTVICGISVNKTSEIHKGFVILYFCLRLVKVIHSRSVQEKEKIFDNCVVAEQLILH